MRLLGSVSEDDMVAAFLAAEAFSEGYGPRIRQILTRLGHPSRLVTGPDTRDEAANAVRRQVLAARRAGGRARYHRQSPRRIAATRGRPDAAFPSAS